MAPTRTRRSDGPSFVLGKAQDLNTMSEINLHLGDCMEAMRQMPDNAYDLAIVDPPYGININNNMGRRKGQKHSGYKKIEWDNQTPPQKYFNELKRVSVNQIIWGANYMIDKIQTKPN